MSHILSIDQGTTSSRAIVFSEDGVVVAQEQKELQLYYPHKGWVEQDANEIWTDTLACARGLVAKCDIIAVGIANQRETTIVWDRETGEPVYNAIVWQDRRTAEQCAVLREAGHEDMIREKTGLLLDPYFSATKIAWILDNVDGARERAERGELAFGTVDSFLLWKLTGGGNGGAAHATDITNASRTMLYNIVTQEWDDELLALFDIPRSLLPEVKDNAADFGMSDVDVLGAAIPIAGMAGDQQAALIGQACFERGMVKSTYGTGCFALMNIGGKFRASQNRLLTTVAYRIGGEIAYAVEGSIFVAGAAVQWLRDGLEVIGTATDSENVAISITDNGGVYFVPAFTGLGAPHWRPDARGVIAGLGRESTKAHIVRAALEAQGYQTHDLMQAMEADGGAEIRSIRADGGLVANNFVCQFLADILDRPVEIPQVRECTALGAAYLAGLQVGLYKDLNDIASRWSAARRYQPTMAQSERETFLKGWQSALGMLLN